MLVHEEENNPKCSKATYILGLTQTVQRSVVLLNSGEVTRAGKRRKQTNPIFREGILASVSLYTI